MSRRRNLRAAEQALWDRVKRSVVPRRPTQPVVEDEAQDASLEATSLRSQHNPPSVPPPHQLQPVAPFAPAYRAPQSKPAQRLISDLDRKTRRKLARGAAAIDSRIDLHGLSQAEAHAALRRFVENAFFARHRTVLIITGKGSGGEGRGILRRQVPHWLAQRDLADLIAEIGPAHQSHGGDGALYVRLRAPAKVRRR